MEIIFEAYFDVCVLHASLVGDGGAYTPSVRRVQGKGGKKHYTHADAYICLARAAVTPKCVIQSSTTILRVHMPGDLVIVNQLVETERTTRAHTGEGWISLTSGNGLKLFQAASAISPERCAHLARIQMVSRDVSESVSGGSSSAANAALRAELVAATKELERLRARYTTVGETNTKQDMQVFRRQPGRSHTMSF